MTKKKKKAKKRQAGDPPSELPPSGKKPKKKAKKLGAPKAKAGAGGSLPTETELFNIMKLMADKHGWSFQSQPPQPGTAAMPPLPPISH